MKFNIQWVHKRINFLKNDIIFLAMIAYSSKVAVIRLGVIDFTRAFHPAFIRCYYYRIDSVFP